MNHKFTLESLKFLDGGKAALAFEKLVERAGQDCIDRPGDTTARTITLKAKLVPVLDEDLTCNEAKIQLSAVSSLPEYKTKVYSFGLKRNGMTFFNEDSPDNVNQGTMLPDDES